MRRRCTTVSTRLLSALVAGLFVLSGCSQPEPEPDKPATERPERASDEPVDVHVLGFNDFHGNLEGPSGEVEVDGDTVDAGGVAPFAAHIGAFRDEHEHTATVVAGDLIGASPLVSALFHDEPTIELFNDIGLDAVSVGNHEFDEGWRELLRVAEGGCHPEDGCREGAEYEGADFPFLAGNVRKPDGSRLFDPYVIREFDGEEVAFVGLTLDEIPSIVMPSGIEGLTFEDEVDVLESVVPKLRERGIEAIVVTIHEGGYPSDESVKEISACPGLEGPIVDIVEKAPDAIDAYITGHTHQTYVCEIDGKLVTSAMSFGRLATEMQLTIDRDSGDVVDASAENVVIRSDGPSDEDVAKKVEMYAKLAEKEAREPVGQITEAIERDPDDSGEMALGRLIADAQLEATAPEDKGGAQIALMNPGGIRTSLDYEAGEGEEGEESEEGVVTFGDLHKVQPFRNQLVVLTLTGKQVHNLLEQQWTGEGHNRILQVSKGFNYAWNPDRPAGERIDPADITLDGEPLDPDASYRITVNNFLAEGGDDFTLLEEGTDRTFGPVDLEAMARYFRKHSPISPPSDSRITRTADESETENPE